MSSALNHVRGLSGISCLRAITRTNIGYKNWHCGDIPSNINPHYIYYPQDIRPRFYTNVSPRASISQAPPIESKINSEQSQSLIEANNPSTSLPAHDYSQRPANKRRTRKRSVKCWLTPSEYLSESLQKAGHSIGYGEGSIRAARNSTKDSDHVIVPKSLLKQSPGSRFVRRSLQTILGQYIQEVDPLFKRKYEGDSSIALEAAIGDVFGACNYRHLEERGYCIDDVVAWAWVLTSQDNYQAASRLFALESDHETRTKHASGPHVPPFLVLLLLKEQYLDAHVLRLLLIHSLHLMSGEALPPIHQLTQSLETNQVSAIEGSSPKQPKVDVTTCMLLTKRLILHARQVWPEALPVIARAVARFLTVPSANESRKSGLGQIKDRSFRTQSFNLCLSLLSAPAKVHPFRSAFLQQQAQFELLRAMAAHKPVFPVTREGYRSVVAVQLAHKKTTAERQSAELKAPSWPPWKEERLGMDSHRGNEGLQSRAMNVLSQMKEAGYSPRVWEEISAILAGWDTDGSPTVQTRALAPPQRALSLQSCNDHNNHGVWVARIRATRTVREAWACFLSYQDHGLPAKAEIYAAMAEKLIYRQKTASSNFDRVSLTLPGDGREVYPEPASARDIIYVRTEPPLLEDFLNEMISRGIRPSGRFLALLLLSAPDLRTGLFYLQSSNLSEDQIKALCTVWRHPSEYQEKQVKALEALPDKLFGSFITFLCKHSPLTVSKCVKDVFMADRTDVPTQYKEPIAFLQMSVEEGPEGHPLAFWHATQLVKLRQPPCRLAWHNLLSAFSSNFSGERYVKRHKKYVRILAWHGICEVFNWMRVRGIAPGPADFQPLCVTFSRAIDAGIKQPELVEKACTLHQFSTELPDIDDRDYFDALVEDGLSLLKAHFDQLVLPSAKTSGVAEQSVFTNSSSDKSLGMPAVLHVPSYATLHSFVRAMGMVGDDDGLLHLLRWMSRSSALLNEVAEDRLNGDQMMRQTLVAIRMYLEKLHPQFNSGDRIASDSNLEEAYDIVSRTPGWEWPDLTEVEDYLNVQ
ncbi:uncharacterized protein N7483_001437 [Penicillium malachiteum]|uniref:uncharacterized protein n=1 Tax=Penicillium malachiteum TaxID=1324776 RepID=UPI00254945D6|nr:uncharacterized protein N7483_001437 [Penicillium malachiteum]KAJ5736312.1 hypothetical protein N7483_001437 [Penicillium malachiteum]